MVWVMGKKVWGLQALGEDYRKRSPLFHLPKPLNPHSKACPKSHHNSPVESPSLNY